MAVFSKPEVKTETLQARFARYVFYFTMRPEQLSRMYQALLRELDRGLETHKRYPNVFHPELCSLMFLDTCVSNIPTGEEKGVFYGIDFGGTNLRAVRVELDGDHGVTTQSSKINIRNERSAAHLPKGLLDKNATATMLFDTIAGAVKSLMQETGDLSSPTPIPIGFTFSFAMDQKRLNSAILTTWAKGFETGSNTKDAVVGRDVCQLLDVAFRRQNVPARVVAALNDTTGTLLSAAYQRPANSPPCYVGIILGTGLNGCYAQPNAADWGYLGGIINTEIGGFDKDLPWNIIDIEVDFASTNRGRQRLEKMIAGLYLPELCRRVVLKVFQAEAPKLAWTHETMPGEACAAVMSDESVGFTETKAILKTMWDWNVTTEYAKMVHELFAIVFDRSAALSAVFIAAMANKTGMLQPAMGGLTVGVDGSLYTQNQSYRDRITHHLNIVLGEDTASLINFIIADDGSGKGAAILAGATKAVARASKSPLF